MSTFDPILPSLPTETRVVYRDGESWTLTARSAHDALKRARWVTDFNGRRVVPSYATRVDCLAPSLDAAPLIGVTSDERLVWALSDCVYVVDVEPVRKLKMAKRAHAAATQALVEALQQREDRLHRDAAGPPLAFTRYKSTARGHFKGGVRWLPAQQRSPELRHEFLLALAENQRLDLLVSDAEAMLADCERAVVRLTPVPRARPISEMPSHALTTEREKLRAEFGSRHAYDREAAFARERIAAIDKELAARRSVEAYGFGVGARVERTPLKTRAERGVLPARGTVVEVEHDTSIRWDDPRTEHRRLIRFDVPYADPYEPDYPIAQEWASIDQLTKVDA